MHVHYQHQFQQDKNISSERVRQGTSQGNPHLHSAVLSRTVQIPPFRHSTSEQALWMFEVGTGSGMIEVGTGSGMTEVGTASGVVDVELR